MRNKTGSFLLPTLLILVLLGAVLYLVPRYSFRIDVMLSRPTLSAVVRMDGDTYAAWGRIHNATDYQVFRRLPEEEWAALGSVGGDELLFIDSCGDEPYEYCVRAAYSEDGKVIACSDYSAAAAAVPAPEALSVPVITGVVRTDEGIEISWEGVDDATSYQVFRRAPGGDWTFLKAVAARNLSAVDDSAGDTAYRYAVRSMFSVGGKVLLHSSLSDGADIEG
ncbi:MAG: hypothetical protein IKD79_05060 [Oscillospiraceae bacterium]|nr:hypothetical protein [Oscillospiraceae bacterium]